ncbi:hypothetical protein ACN6K9_002526 [Streptomyces sp. SAS_267]|uniref:hypothetical protein n=1 Tax=unclassified Streptomyces TaxID=2593676 RepID=UPI0036FCDC17
MNRPEQSPAIEPQVAGTATALLPIVVDAPLLEQRWALAANSGAGPNARLRMRPWLTVARWNGNIDAATRVTDRLVDNAVRHGEPLPGGIVLLRVFVLPETEELAIEVQDGRPEFPGFEQVATQSGEARKAPPGLWWVRHYRGQLAFDVIQDGALTIGKTVQAIMPTTWDGAR